METSTVSKEHMQFLNRIKKSLYYAKLPVINYLSFPVVELAAELFTEVKSDRTLKRLDVDEASRISRNACVSPCSLVLALLYIKRLKNCNPEYLDQVSPSELFLVSLLVASKYLHDDGEEDEVFNKEWAKSGQISTLQINKLEKDFLAAIDWKIVVQQEDFWEKLQQFEKNLASREIQKRNWCSYTELCCLMNCSLNIAIARMFINISSICLAVYIAGLTTLLGTAQIAHLITRNLSHTFLDTRQSVNLTSIDLINPMIDVQSQMVNDVLPIFNSSTCDTNSCMTAEIDIANSQWWSNSMTWFNHNALENDAAITNHANRLLDNNANYLFNSTQCTIDKMKEIEISQDFKTEDYHRNISWEEILEMMSTLMKDLKSEQFHFKNIYHSTALLRIYY